MDFRSKSLELYNLDAIVKFKEGSEPFNKYGEFLNGVLIERIWGEASSRKLAFLFNSNTTVTALKFQCNEIEITISCDDIETINQATLSITGGNDID